MINSVFYWIFDYTPYLVFLSVLVAIFRFQYIREHCPEMLYFLGMAVFFEGLSRYLHGKGVNNLPYLHLYTFLEFGVISLFFFRTLKNYFSRKLLLSLIIGFLIFAPINAFFIQGIYNFNTNARALECIILILFSFMYYYMILNELKVKEPTKSTDFWLNTGFLIYFSGSFVVFMLSNVLLKKSLEVINVAWAMHSMLLAVLHILISIGLWKTAPR